MYLHPPCVSANLINIQNFYFIIFISLFCREKKKKVVEAYGCIGQFKKIKKVWLKIGTEREGAKAGGKRKTKK